MKDASTPILAGLLALLLAAAGGVAESTWLPTGPAALGGAVVLLLAAWVAVVVPALARAGPARVLEAGLVAAPTLAFALRAAPGDLIVPWAPLCAAAAVGLVATWLPPALRRRLAALSGMALVAVPVLGAAEVVGPPADARLDPRALDVAQAFAPEAAVDPRTAVPAAWTVGDADRPLRVGALARSPVGASSATGTTPLAAARWLPVPEAATATLPMAGPVVRVVGASGAPTRAGSATVVGGPWREQDVLDLDPYDAVLLRVPAGDDPASAETLARFVRRGGLLVGIGEVPTWPEALGRRLGRAAFPDDAGPAEARALGAGRVAWVRAPDETEALLAAGLARPLAATAFDRAIAAPVAPDAFPRWTDDVAGRRPAARLLAVLTAVLAVVAPLLPGRRRLVALAGIAALGVLQAVRLASPAGAPRVEAFALDLGGPGGRRVEGLFLSAGPSGWVGLPGANPEKAVGLRAVGFRLVRTETGVALGLAPGGEGWIVEEGVGQGVGTGLVRVEEVPVWAVTLLRRGEAGPARWRMYAGSRPYEGPRPPGLSAPEAERALVLVPVHP